MPLQRPDEASRDHALLKQVASGDAEAFTDLFRRRRSEVYRFAVHMTGCPATAEDITQEVFLTVMREAGRYDPSRASVVAWLLGIARNHARRRLDRDRLPRVDVQPAAGEPAGGHDPSDALQQAERIAAVREAIHALPPCYREVVVLCDLQELRYADAASVLGCAVGTVRSRLHRGRALVAARLRREDGGTHELRLRRSRCFA